MNGPLRNSEDTAAFREAVSQWQLAARTEVKRTSLLPSSMFDACDPMLEASLVESVEAMMHCLHQPAANSSQEQAPLLPGDMRTETVAPEELKVLPQHVPNVAPAQDLESGISAEYLSLLIDTCTTGDAATKSAARTLLLRDFAIEAASDLETTTNALCQCLQDVGGQSDDNPAAHDRLVKLCGAIAASVLIDAHEDLGNQGESGDCRHPRDAEKS